MKITLDITIKPIIIPTDNGTIQTNFFSLNHNPAKGYFVQDVDKQQNTELFAKGLHMIFAMEGKRGEFLRYFASFMQKDIEEFENGDAAHPKYCSFIAFVCDLANHNNLKDWKGVYHKDFPKFVSNLCWNYYLDEDFNTFKNGDFPTFNYYQQYDIENTYNNTSSYLLHLFSSSANNRTTNSNI